MALVAIALAVYAPARNFGFLTFDDPDYVSANAHVGQGLTTGGVAWALTAFHAGTWMPTTWLSYMIEASLHGIDAGWFHVTNVGLHIASTLVLFGVLVRLTGALGRSAFVAALFAVHPLHVESVAWIAERKDVLSTVFWWLAIWAYVAYVRRPHWKRYALVAGCFAAGLMAKPMLVTLPATLLLLDVWPLGRFSDSRGWGALIREKLPLVALSAVSTAITVAAQQQVGAVAELNVLPLATRVANGLISYVAYLGKAIWPDRLAILYPFPTDVSTVAALASLALLAGVTVLAIRARRSHPYIIVGWCWYLITLLPVIGLAQVGSHAMADRFTYVPLVGIFILVAWGVPELAARWLTRLSPTGVTRRWGLASVATAAILVAAAAARVQAGYWQDSLTCWQHTLDVTSDNFIAEDAMGGVLTDQGRTVEALAHFARALEIHPGFAGAHYNLGVALAKLGRTVEAIPQYQESLRLSPNHPKAHNNLGRALVSESQVAEGIAEYREAIRQDPDFVQAHANLGEALATMGRLDDAIAEFREAVRADPTDDDSHDQLGRALTARGKLDDAIVEFREALRLNPSSAEADEDLGLVLFARGQVDEAIAEYRRALALAPAMADAHQSLATAYLAQHKTAEAIEEFKEVLRLDPKNVEARQSLAELVRAGR